MEYEIDNVTTETLQNPFRVDMIIKLKYPKNNEFLQEIRKINFNQRKIFMILASIRKKLNSIKK